MNLSVVRLVPAVTLVTRNKLSSRYYTIGFELHAMCEVASLRR